jgi:hypothetical protein
MYRKPTRRIGPSYPGETLHFPRNGDIGSSSTGLPFRSFANRSVLAAKGQLSRTELDEINKGILKSIKTRSKESDSHIKARPPLITPSQIKAQATEDERLAMIEAERRRKELADKLAAKNEAEKGDLIPAPAPAFPETGAPYMFQCSFTTSSLSVRELFVVGGACWNSKTGVITYISGGRLEPKKSGVQYIYVKLTLDETAGTVTGLVEKADSLQAGTDTLCYWPIATQYNGALQQTWTGMIPIHIVKSEDHSSAYPTNPDGKWRFSYFTNDYH